MVQWWEERTTCLQKVKQCNQCLLSFLDSSLQYSFCDSVSISYTDFEILLTQLAAFSLDPNGLGIVMTNTEKSMNYSLYLVEV